MKKILVLAPTPSDATSFWRAFGPFSQIKDPRFQIDFNYMDQIDWAVQAPHDIVFAQRFFTRQHQNVLEFAKSFNKKIWLDYDDLVTALPRSNPAYKTYENDESKQALGKILRLADVITVSTEDIKEHFKALTQAPIKVVPNAWPDHLLPFNPKPFKKHKRIFWRGGPTHFEDLWNIKEELKQLASDLPDYQFLFVGHMPYFIPEVIPKEQVGYIDNLGIVKFYNVLRAMEADLAIVPLNDSPFNRCKSAIGWLEATFAGAATVAPDFREWQNMAISRYKSGVAGDFRNVVLQTLEEAKGHYELSCKLIKKSFLLSEVNKFRVELLKTL